jgi:CelD/BcsL family acetyltransferase involved in cellulose biosynthesis
MRVHTDWGTAAFELPAVAANVGPFPHRAWLETWWDHRGGGELMLVEGDTALIPLRLERGRLEFVGEPDLTDYHSPLGPDTAETLAKFVADLPGGIRIELDSLPEEAASVVARGLRDGGFDPRMSRHETAAVLRLPDSFDEYLASLGKKERHEMRRKRRRFEADLGPAHVERRSGPTAVATFAAMHRTASGPKGSFMTEEMEQFFSALHQRAGAVVDFVVDGSGNDAAAVFSFVSGGGYYLYNSAYDPRVAHQSPGIVLLSLLVQNCIATGCRIFDFLKGDEPYKFRHGATARPLWRVTATTGGGR